MVVQIKQCIPEILLAVVLLIRRLNSTIVARVHAFNFSSLSHF